MIYSFGEKKDIYGVGEAVRSEWGSSRHTADFLHTDMNKVFFFLTPENLGEHLHRGSRVAWWSRYMNTI